MRGSQEGDKLFRTIESGGYRRISDLWHKTDLQPSGIASQRCHPFNSGGCAAQSAPTFTECDRLVKKIKGWYNTSHERIAQTLNPKP